MTRKMTMIKKTLMVLMVTFGINVSWGQEDYSGTYYIASGGLGQKNNTGTDDTKYTYNPSDPSNNFYLCPTEGWCFYKPDNDFSNDGTTYPNPFLTTYKCRSTAYHNNNASDAVWIIKKAPNSDYYYIIQKSTGRYLVSNGQIRTTGNKGQDRIRVHLEAIAEGDLDGKTQALFSIDYDNSCWRISPIDLTDGQYYTTHDGHSNHTHLVVNYGNYNYLDGRSGKDGGPNDNTIGNYTNTAGTVGIYTQGDANTPFYLEEYIKRPTIAFNSSNLIEITPAQSGTITIKYTTDGKTPTSEYGETYSVPFDPPANTTMIKAIVIVNDEESNVATFTPTFFLGENHKYLIQSVNCQFYYLIPNQKTTAADYPKNVSTLNVPCNTMAWSFENAVDNDGQYYYIHNSQGGYLYYPTTDNTDNYIFLQQNKDTNDDGYKFSITSHASGGFNLIPKNQTIPVNKTSVGSNDTERLRAVKLAGAIKDASSRWNIILYNNTTGIPQWTDKPFDESTNSVSHFYQITNVNQPTKPLILNNSGFIKSETPPEIGYDSRKSMWVIKKVEQTDGLLDYYTFQNAYTGDWLYYNGSGREIVANASPGVLQTGMPTAEGANVTWAHFVIVQTVSGYNIIPRVLVDNTKATSRNSTSEAFNCIGRASGKDWTGTFYDTDDGARWTFVEQTDVACMDPVFEVSDGNITLSCVTNASNIYINTADDTDPTTESTLYNASTTSWSESLKLRIKAIAVVSDGTNTTSSRVVTLLNKPDVTLEAGPYVYKADYWEPVVTLSIGETTATTGFNTDYSNNKDAGTARVTITDNDAADALYIWNVPITEFTIEKAPLTIKANDKSIGYGDEPDNDGVTYNGFVVPETEETEGVLGGTLEYSYTTSGDDPHPYTPYDPQYGNQGNYVITPGGLTSTNYDITFIPGTMTVTAKSLGDGALAEGFTIEFDESGEMILKFGSHTLTKDVDYTIDGEVTGTKYSTRTISGMGNYTGYLAIRNAIVHFTSDDNLIEWSATFVAESSGENDIGHALPDGISAYIISDIEGAWAIPEPLDYIPVGVPVLLVAHEEKNGFLVSDANSESVNEITDLQKGYNKLKKVTAESAHFNTKQIYVLYKNEFVLNKEGDLGQGKVYMENPNYNTPSPSPAPARLTIIWGNETDIEDIQTNGAMEMGNERWYTIDGRRLSWKPTAKGLYIVNGKKKVVK